MNAPGYRVEEKKTPDDIKSQTSYKSTHSSRSSVLERAREYNRRIEQQNRVRRSKSLERSSSQSEGSVATPRSNSSSRRSVSAGRGQKHLSTRERAMASVRKESSISSQQRGASQITDHTHPLTPTSTQYSSMQTPSQQLARQQAPNVGSVMSAATQGQNSRRSSNQQPNGQINGNRVSPRSLRNSSHIPPEEEAGGVVTPELLVEALSGHEDGLLAIAERLMEHYDAGYDAMGEAIIDAFADVQKLFQHVVEAAHMEGAAFESSRHEKEIDHLRRQLDAAGSIPQDDAVAAGGLQGPNGPPAMAVNEFIDQDVKDVLAEAIRKGTGLREANKHQECFDLYDRACQAASALLPVDSDHRGHLQMSKHRAESMNAERACAVLRYAMDGVLRSGLRAVKTPLPDHSQRADVVLSRPKAHPSVSGVSGQTGVVQSSDEALASLMEEMKEVMSAPVYHDTPLQAVARRFWSALSESLKAQQKNEERLEQQLGKLKGDYLLAKAEWEEKLNQSTDLAESYKDKYERLREKAEPPHTDQSRTPLRNEDDTNANDMSLYGSVKSAASAKTSSVASLGSGLAQQAKTIVNSMNQFNCTAPGAAMDGMRNDDLIYESNRSVGGSGRRHRTTGFDQPRSTSSSRTKPSRTFREYARSPQHVDV